MGRALLFELQQRESWRKAEGNQNLFLEIFVDIFSASRERIDWREMDAGFSSSFKLRAPGSVHQKGLHSWQAGLFVSQLDGQDSDDGLVTEGSFQLAATLIRRSIATLKASIL